MQCQVRGTRAVLLVHACTCLSVRSKSSFLTDG
jgi:hypothetical protein